MGRRNEPLRGAYYCQHKTKSAESFATNSPLMLRFIITIVVGAMAYTAMNVFDQIQNPSDDNLGAFFSPIAGGIFSVIVVVVFLLPLRAGLRHFLPGKTQRSHALIASIVLLALVTIITLMGSASTFPLGRMSFWVCWASYTLALIASLFWPLSARVVNRGETTHEHAD